VLASSMTCASRRPPTRPNATCAPPKPRKRSPAGSGQRQPPATATPSAATSPPPPNTTPAPSPPCATPSAATPGCPPSPPSPDKHPASDGDLNVYARSVVCRPGPSSVADLAAEGGPIRRCHGRQVAQDGGGLWRSRPAGR
jgi:hypothetical protein